MLTAILYLSLAITRPIYTPPVQVNLNGVWVQDGGNYHFFVSDDRVTVYRDTWIGRGVIDGRIVFVNWNYERSGIHAFESEWIIQDSDTIIGRSKMAGGGWYQDNYSRKKR